MACAKASTPVAAAIFRGRFLIISGSSRTLSAIIASLTMPTFSSCSGTATIALGVASLPVPAVVGIISVGQHFFARPGASSRSCTVELPSKSTPASLAVSITLPPPTARIISAPSARQASTSFWTWP